MTSPCPICGRTLGDTRSIDVCSTCHHDLQVAATASVTSTGEFSMAELVALGDASRAQPVSTPTAEVSCTWCGRAGGAVRKLLSHGNAHICNACIGLCADILQAELGDDWAT